MIIGEIKKGEGSSFDLGGLGKRFAAAQQYLLTADLASLAPGSYDIDGKDVYVMIQEYTVFCIFLSGKIMVQ